MLPEPQPEPDEPEPAPFQPSTRTTSAVAKLLNGAPYWPVPLFAYAAAAGSCTKNYFSIKISTEILGGPPSSSQSVRPGRLRQALSGRRRETLLYIRCMRIGAKIKTLIQMLFPQFVVLCCFLPVNESLITTRQFSLPTVLWRPKPPLPHGLSIVRFNDDKCGQRWIHITMRSIKGTKRLHPLAKHNRSLRVANTLFVQVFRLHICKGLAWQSTNCGVVPQVFLLSACALSVSSVILPVSSDQGTAFKNLDTKLVYQNENRKNGGSNGAGMEKNTCPLGRLQLLGKTGKTWDHTLRKVTWSFPPRKKSRWELPQNQRMMQIMEQIGLNSYTCMQISQMIDLKWFHCRPMLLWYF